MAETIVRSDEEIEKVLDWCHEARREGSHYSGQTYEQGLRDMYAWLIGDSDDDPSEG